MKKLVFVALMLLIVGCQEESQPIKVACVGDSITFGAGIVNREKNSYPAQLQEYLGDGYEVRNFGVSATTVLCEGKQPYVQTKQYQESL
jgi:lysophospholipase L1-like esterase